MITVRAEKFYNDGLNKYYIVSGKQQNPIRLYFAPEKEILLSYIKYINLTRITFQVSIREGKYYLESFMVC